MPAPYQPFLATYGQPVQAELPHGLQQGIARLASRVLSLAQQTFIDERAHPLQDVQIAGSIGDGLDRLQRASAGEDRKPAEEGLLMWGEQIMTPGDGVTQCLLAGWGVSRPAREYLEAIAEALEERLGWEELDPRRGEFDG